MLAKTYGAAVFGVDAKIITIEVNVGQGTKFWMSGLPDSAVKESEILLFLWLAGTWCQVRCFSFFE